MGYYFDFDSLNGILRCTLEGDVTDKSLEECYEVTVRHAAFINPVACMMDFSNVDSLDVSSQTVRDLALRPSRIPGSRPRFLVVPSAYMYGMARMFQQYGSETRPGVHVVRSADEAYTCLGVREPRFEPVTGHMAIRSKQAPVLVSKARA
jgi:hypothetical protein